MTAKRKSSTPSIAEELGSPNPMLLMVGVLVLFAAGIVLNELQSILLPLVIAAFLSIIFSPIVTYLKDKGVPVAISLVVVLLSIALILFLLSLLVYSSTESFVRELPKYERRLSLLVANFLQNVTERLAEFEIKIEEINWSQTLQLSSLTTAVTSGLGSFVSFLSSLFLILLFMVFMLAGSGELAAKVKSAFRESQARRITRMIENMETRVRQYLITKTLISAATGFLAFMILGANGVDFALFWGFVTFLLNFIPSLGSLLAVILPFTLSLLQFDSLSRPLLVLILLSSMQMLMGNILEPKIMAFRLNLSPLVILVSLIFWGWLWGVWGMVLAVPIMATVKIIAENIEGLHPIAVFMSSQARDRE